MIDQLRNQINEYFIGKEEVVENLLTCLLAGGHVLLEDFPGVGKTTVARILAGSIDASFGRIQFTPDTLPSDITGFSMFNMKTSQFEYKEGAIMRQIILADEINRTSPKTQSALLETLQEGSVTVDSHRYHLPTPFMVIATQNPVEFIGTFSLPEASLDRFMMKLTIGYPDAEAEIQLASKHLDGSVVDNIKSVCKSEDIVKIQKEVSNVKIKENVISYAREIVNLTREDQRFLIGGSPRALIHLLKAAQAKAYLNGRDYVKPDDIKAVCVNVLHHRLVLTPEAKIKKENTDSIINSIILKVKVPMEK